MKNIFYICGIYYTIMKRIIPVLFALFLFVGLSSCNKIVENKLDGTYRVDRVFKNGSDNTQSFNTAFANYKLVLAEGGTYVITWVTFSVQLSQSGHWLVNENGKNIQMTPGNGDPVANWKIIERKKKSLNVQYAEDGDVYDVQLLKD